MTAVLLPRHDPATWRAQAAASQRDRLLVAMAEASVDVGYANVRVADVISRAGVSRRTFYEWFSNLEECFIATYDRGVDALAAALGDSLTSVADADDWQSSLRDLLRTYLDVLAAEPVFTQFAMVEVLAAGPAARQRYLDVVDRFHALMRTVDDVARRSTRRPPRSDVELAVLAGGLNRLVMTEVLAGRGDRLGDHLDELARIGLELFVGAAA